MSRRARSTDDDDDELTLTLPALDPEPALTLDQPIHLVYAVTLTEHQLSTDLHVTNKSKFPSYKPLVFQALLHTYIRVPDASTVRITPLKGLEYTDETAAGSPTRTEERDQVDVLEFTDSVYRDGPGTYQLTWAGGQGMRVKARGFKDVVVWNPRENGAKMGDMEDGGWSVYDRTKPGDDAHRPTLVLCRDRFVCLEPGYVAGWAQVDAGQTWVGGQTLTPMGP